MSTHVKEKCVHGTIVRQCRCIGGVWRIVACPDHCLNRKQAEVVSEGKPKFSVYDWEKENEGEV